MNKLISLYVKPFCANSIEVFALIKSFGYSIRLFMVDSPEITEFEGHSISHITENGLMLAAIPTYPVGVIDGKIIIGLSNIRDYVTRD